MAAVVVAKESWAGGEAEAAVAVGEISACRPSQVLSLKNKNKIISDFYKKKKFTLFTLYTSTLSKFHKELKF